MPKKFLSGVPTVGAESLAYEYALVLGLAGTSDTTLVDAADFVVPVPWNMTLKRMKLTAKVAPVGTMTVQARVSTNAITPSYSNITGFVVAFAANESSAVVDPADANIDEGNLVNLSITTGSGATNLLMELIGVRR